MLGGNEARSDGSKIENAIHGVDDIGAWFAIDNQQDCGFAVGESAGAKIFHGVGHGGDIADAHSPLEKVDLDQLVRVTRALTVLTLRRCGVVA